MAVVSGAAFAMLRGLLQSYGLDELADWAYQEFVNGKSSDEIMIDIESQPVFRQKFSAIFDRRAKGLPPVSVQELVTYKQQATNLEHFYDLPQGMISDDQHINAFVAGDTSFDELTQRVQQGAMAAYNSPPEVKQYLQENYGISEGGLIGYFTDPTHSMPYIQKVAEGAILGGTAQRQGFGAISAAEAERLATAGVTQGQAEQAFGQLGQAGEIINPLAGTDEQAIAREQQLGVVEGKAADVAALARRARARAAVTQEGGRFAGKALVTGTDRG